MRCENCGVVCDFDKLEYDEVNNLIIECSECGAVCYEDGTLVKDEITVK